MDTGTFESHLLLDILQSHLFSEVELLHLPFTPAHRYHYNPNRRHFDTGIPSNVCTAVSVSTGGRKSSRMRFERTQGSTHASPHAVEIGQLAVQEDCFECGCGSGEHAAWHLDVKFVR